MHQPSDRTHFFGGSLRSHRAAGLLRCACWVLTLFFSTIPNGGSPLAAARSNTSGSTTLNIGGLSDVLSLDLYPEGKKIHALVAGRFSGRANPMLAYLASTDGGRNWSSPVFVNSEGDPAIVSRRGNDAQLAASGAHLVAAWQQRGQFPTGGPLRVAYSADFGRTWTPASLPIIDDPTDNQSYPDLAADTRGAFHLVWLDDREESGNTQGLRYLNSSDGGRNWSQQATIDGAVCTCCWNRIGVLQDQSVAVLYRDDDPHDMRLAARDQTGHWKDRGNVGRFDWHFAGCPHCGGGFASSPRAGSWLLHSVVWTGLESAAGLYYLRSSDLGRNWSSPLQLGDGNSREADIAALSSSRIAVVYGITKSGNSQIHLRQSSDSGKTWSQAKALSKDQTTADHPRVLATPFGLRAFWTERVTGIGRILTMFSLDS